MKVHKRRTQNIRYADNTILMAETLQDLKTFLDCVLNASEKRGLTHNVRKTKCMTIHKNKTL